ncbi:MAG: ABC transporter ATP-binding protein [Longimicrobiales bacterium]|nr:ABC transporter ATP-binding protein [Longimicrobiales bacterium]
MTDPRALRDLGEHPVWIRMAGIGKRYGRRPVLRDVDVCFRPGRVTAILGPNGAGKTTLLKALLGLVRPDGGTITVDGSQVGEAPGYRNGIGYMPQLPRFPENLSGTELAAMLDDVRGFRGEPDETLVDALGLRPEMEKPFRTLSGGNRQKLNAALAFRYGTPVLVLDEPTAGMDPVAARILKERVRSEREAGRTILLTSHDLGQLQALADDVVFLLDGVVRFEGEVGQLLAATGEDELEGAIAALILGQGGGDSGTGSKGVA